MIILSLRLRSNWGTADEILSENWDCAASRALSDRGADCSEIGGACWYLWRIGTVEISYAKNISGTTLESPGKAGAKRDGCLAFQDWSCACHGSESDDGKRKLHGVGVFGGMWLYV